MACHIGRKSWCGGEAGSDFAGSLKNQEARDTLARAFCEPKRLDLRSASLLPKVPRIQEGWPACHSEGSGECAFLRLTRSNDGNAGAPQSVVEGRQVLCGYIPPLRQLRFKLPVELGKDAQFTLGWS